MAAGGHRDGTVKLPKVRRPSTERLAVSVGDSLKQAIRSGDLQPGDRLPNETDLCAHFGVSRITLREAIQMLRSLGLVEATRGRGTFVREPDPESFLQDLAYYAFTNATSVQDLFEVRSLLESHAAKRAAEHGTAEQRKELLGIVHSARTQLAAVKREKDLQKIAEADTHYHLHIAVMSGNLVLEQLMHRVMQILEVVRVRSLAIPGQPECSWQQHLDIAEAIDKGDSDLAVSRTIEHVEAVKMAIINSVDAE